MEEIKKNKQGLKTFLTVLAIVIPAILVIYFGFKNYSLEKEKFAIEMSPKIKYANRLFFTLFDIGPDTAVYKNYHKLPHDSVRGIGYPASINISFNIKITNIGKSTAKWKKLIIFDVDTNTENFLIRENIFKDNFLNNLIINESPIRQTKLLKEIYSNDTVNLPIEKRIRALNKENEVTLHILFYYTSEDKTLYDTYMWAHVKITDTLKIAIHNDKSNINDFIHANMVCCETKRYSDSEKETIYRKLGIKDE